MGEAGFIEDTVEKGSREPIYERKDIPAAFDLEENVFGIDWMGHPNGELSQRLSEGLELNQKQYEQCLLAIDEIKERYYPSGYNGYDDWYKNYNGTYSLNYLMPNSRRELRMNVFNENSSSLNSSMKRFYLSNVCYVDEILFFTECLTTYLKYAGIVVPCIRSDIADTKVEKVENYDGSILELKENTLSYSFEIPYIKDSENGIKDLLKKVYNYWNVDNVDIDSESRSIRFRDKVIAKRQVSEIWGDIWEGRGLNELEAIRFFYIISRYNKDIGE